MQLIVDNLYSGFKVLTSKYIEEVSSQAYILEHLQSGAKVFYLANDDDNKVFSISFRTPPTDDTGVPHILEHSSLCGSRKYRLKEPFVDLVKGSLNTFLNAMTYPDKTMYPVASRNDKDFHNLMDVYLDAVFYPLIYENKYTLRQEGWHYNLDSVDGELSYNGVVYNEMKGVYSSPDSYLELEAMRALFPDTNYRFESGGYPDAIPGLTQEAFENFHRTLYSPENSYIYLYGDMDIEETLSYLDGEYLSNFTKTGEVDTTIAVQAPLERTADVTATYSVDADEDCSGKTYHELSIVVGKATDVQTCMAMGILESVLIANQGSPLRRALLESGVGQNISGSYEASLQQPVFAIRAAGSEPEKRDLFLSTIYKTLQQLTIDGLDKQMLEAALNAAEFKLRENDFGSYPKGLIYGITIMDTWLYGGCPMAKLEANKHLEALREGLKTNYFEHLIETYLLDNTHKVLVTLVPQPGKEEAEQAAQEEAMAQLKASMSQEELEMYAAQCAELHRLQAEPDSEEARASIPVLERSDIRRNIHKHTSEKELVDGNKFIYVPLKTNKITYTNWYFDISDMTPRQASLAFLLADIIGKLDTKSYTYGELTTLGIMYTGGIDFDVVCYCDDADPSKYKIYFTVKGKSLSHNAGWIFKLLHTMVLETKFSDLTRFQELVGELKTDWDDNFFSRGQGVAINRLFSYFNAAARIAEKDNLSYYQLLKELNDNFEEQAPAVLQELEELLQLFCRNGGLSFVYACEEEDRAALKEQAQSFIKQLPLLQGPATVQELPAPGHNEAITTAGKVQYVVAGGDFRAAGYEFTGAMKVLETMLRYEYLWTKIRIQGGAYGATTVFNANGMLALATYRDPQLQKSLDAFYGLADWLENLELSDRELDKYVIGTMSGIDVPLTNSMVLNRVALTELKQVSEAKRQLNRDQVLDVTLQDLRNLAPLIRATLAAGHLCVVGCKQTLDSNKDLFESVINV